MELDIEEIVSNKEPDEIIVDLTVETPPQVLSENEENSFYPAKTGDRTLHFDISGTQRKIKF